MYLPIDILSKMLYYERMTTIILTKYCVFADTAATQNGKISHVVKIFKRGDRLVTGTGAYEIVKKFRSGWHRFMLETLGFTICEVNFKKTAKNDHTVVIFVSEFDTVVYNIRYKQFINDGSGNRITIAYKHQKTIHRFIGDNGAWLTGGSGMDHAKDYLDIPNSKLEMESGRIAPICREAIQYAASIRNCTSKYVLDVEVPKETWIGSVLRSFMLFINGETEIEIV